MCAIVHVNTLMCIHRRLYVRVNVLIPIYIYIYIVKVCCGKIEGGDLVTHQQPDSAEVGRNIRAGDNTSKTWLN